jgi:hypothetical protein
LFLNFVLWIKNDIIIYVIKRIYKVYLNLFGLILNLLQIFYVNILEEMEKTKREKTSQRAFIHSGPSLLNHSGPGATNQNLKFKSVRRGLQSQRPLYLNGHIDITRRRIAEVSV